MAYWKGKPPIHIALGSLLSAIAGMTFGIPKGVAGGSFKPSSMEDIERMNSILG